jgi:hypothetical protein
MATLTNLRQLHDALGKIIQTETAAFRQKTRGNASWYSGTTTWYSRRPNQKGKCKREHQFMATFVPLNRQLGKLLQQAENAVQSNFDVTTSRFRNAAQNLVFALFKAFIEAPGRIPQADMAELPVTTGMLRGNEQIQAVYGADFLERLSGNTLGALRASFAVLEVEQRAIREMEQNKKAIVLESILGRAEGFLGSTELELLTQAVRKSYTSGQRSFLKIS